jgi:hypothetical protein
MIPRSWYRMAGSGGGGKCAYGGRTPYWCKVCGKTVPARKVSKSIDVCKRCRVTNRKGKR